MASILANATSMSAILKPVDISKTGQPLGDSLKNFLDVAMKVAQIDEAILGARASAPSQDDSEVFKWHEVSIKALMWTRSSLLEQQGNALGQLKDAAVSQRSPVLSSSTIIRSETPAYSSSETTVQLSSSAKSSAVGRLKSSKSLTPAQVGAKVAAGDMSVGSLRDDLERLKEYDSQQCLIVRRIKRLGLGSPEILREHFSSFGDVQEMLISHSFEKKSAKCRADRVRPAALGFIVMDSVEGAQAALRAGPTLMVRDVDVEVNIFEPLEALQQRDVVETQPSGLKSFQ